MSAYFTITGKHTGHKWLAEIGAAGTATYVVVRREWKSDPQLGVSYIPGNGRRILSLFAWDAVARARLHVWWSDWRWHRMRAHIQKVRRIAQRGDRP